MHGWRNEMEKFNIPNSLINVHVACLYTQAGTYIIINLSYEVMGTYIIYPQIH